MAMRTRSRHRHRFHNSQRHRERKQLEEYLEILWYMHERHGTNLKKFMIDEQSNWDPTIADKLKEMGYIEENEIELKFTRKGYEKARQLVRSHRLAERLLTDVLNMKLDYAETGACEFEHIVVPEIVDGICTLLGHPKVCPHGLPIPDGLCCREAKRSIESVIKNITRLEIGKKAKVAYINTRSNSRMHQLTQLGIHPGVEVWIHQKFPVLVLRINHTQIALDEAVAKDILVWEQGIG
jgi:DtxR family Mn-dependent transcriptional regulator